MNMIKTAISGMKIYLNLNSTFKMEIMVNAGSVMLKTNLSKRSAAFLEKSLIRFKK